MPGDFAGGGSRIENDDFTGLHEVGSGAADLSFFRAVNGGLEAERVVAGWLELPDRAAMRPNDGAGGAESIQIGADSHCGNRKPLDQVANGDLPFLLKQIEDLPATLLGDQRVFTLGTSHRDKSKVMRRNSQLFNPENRRRRFRFLSIRDAERTSG